jgi:hypothetical protein
VLPIVFRSRMMNTTSRPPEKITPNTGYHSKKKSLTAEATVMAYP